MVIVCLVKSETGKKSRLVLFNKTCSRINPRPAKWWLVLVGKLLSFRLTTLLWFMYQFLLLITDRLLFYYYWSKNSIIIWNKISPILFTPFLPLTFFIFYSHNHSFYPFYFISTLSTYKTRSCAYFSHAHC